MMYEDRLGKVPIFSACTDDELRAIAAVAQSNTSKRLRAADELLGR